jgi:hypothetical protein
VVFGERRAERRERARAFRDVADEHDVEARIGMAGGGPLGSFSGLSSDISPSVNGSESPTSSIASSGAVGCATRVRSSLVAAFASPSRLARAVGILLAVVRGRVLRRAGARLP